jgi:hypothetical protein
VPFLEHEILERCFDEADARGIGSEPLSGDFQHRGRRVDERELRAWVALGDAQRERAGAAAKLQDIVRGRRESSRELAEHLIVAGQPAPYARVVLRNDGLEVASGRLLFRHDAASLRVVYATLGRPAPRRS